MVLVGNQLSQTRFVTGGYKWDAGYPKSFDIYIYLNGCFGSATVCNIIITIECACEKELCIYKYVYIKWYSNIILSS